MTVSDKVRAAIALKGKQNTDAAAALGISMQAFNNKMYRGTFNADELIKIADELNYELAFIDKYGQKIIFMPSDLQEDETQK